MSILDKLLKRRGIKSVDELDKEEKATFENWRKILSKEKLEIEDLKEFCQIQIDIIENKWKDYNLENNKKAEMIPYHTVYKTISQAINAPQIERSNLEAQLNQMLNI